MKDIATLARQFLHTRPEDLTERERRVLERFIERRRISRNISKMLDKDMSFGDRLADKVAAFGGSWKFIILFGVVLALWIGGNTILVLGKADAFDPYPFIFLNLILSMLAAIQAPVIMMSQNRQASKDRAAAGYDYEVNLKAELEILQLHEKLDEMRQNQLTTVLEQQAAQLALLERLVQAPRDGAPQGA
ncbi:MAG: DUF1003 domain-containing protein [Alphaproteobacteria bacterium]|nr:DUF1003 domain-containing protein [Alphaproteobacteria bacterium]MBU2083426.1 DUF1003 domain-containing protein [Alphaproteobacteria bacterium]MBU2143609.1 DUF1003 domain-containing protein [Alphaproteobacteria bacterium]MBU2195990.1 DUF1003 domain-containing protein [Alphaproteobacteria bacterium]